MAEDYSSVVQGIYDEGTTLIAFLTLVEGELEKQGFAPTTAEMYSAVFAQMAADIQRGGQPHSIPHSGPGLAS